MSDHQEVLSAAPAVPAIRWTTAAIDFGDQVGTDGVTRRIIFPSLVVPEGTKIGEFVIPRHYSTGGIVLRVG